MRILVVEDDKLLNWSLVQSLSKSGFEVRPTSCGLDAVEEFRKTNFDIILLDYQLPDVNGLEVARQVRIVQPRVTVFLLTAFQRSELAVDEGLIDGYFNKPIDLNQLCRTLKKIPGAPSLGECPSNGNGA